MTCLEILLSQVLKTKLFTCWLAMWTNSGLLHLLTQLLLILTCIRLAQLDCGCNKLQRDDSKEANQNSDNQDKQSKICEADAVKNNKYYRDYYDESQEKHNQVERDEPGMSFIPGGEYFIGTNEPNFLEDHESPERKVVLKDFYIDKYEVANTDFKKFIDATQHQTDAEKFGDSFVFKAVLTEEQQKQYEDFRATQALWWYKIKGVSWQHPIGPSSDLKDLWDHPVVHVSWHDAVAYCKWAGKRLPTENEWEAACRGGKRGKLFPWGNKLMPHSKHWANIWQGEFPDSNTLDDGYITTCPVGKFRQNNFDIYNIVGNVWEWTQDLWDAREKDKVNPNRVKKGGSFMCHKVYCYRYRCAARSQNTEDSTAGNLGFRCAKDLQD